MGCFNLSLLGTFQALLGDRCLVAFESDKARALLAYLAVEADRPHRRDVLAGLLWSDSPERTARTNLRSALANLRQLLEDHEAQPPFFEITRQTIQFNRFSDYSLDVDDFLAAIAQFPGSKDSSEQELKMSRIASLKRGEDLYKGQFLAGFNLRNAPLFDEWALITRESLQRKATRALNQLAGYCLEKSDYEQAIQLARKQIALEPFQEAAHQQLIWALALNGQRNEALVHYDQFKGMLADELSVEPIDETIELIALIHDGQLPGTPATGLALRR